MRDLAQPMFSMILIKEKKKADFQQVRKKNTFFYRKNEKIKKGVRDRGIGAVVKIKGNCVDTGCKKIALQLEETKQTSQSIAFNFHFLTK